MRTFHVVSIIFICFFLKSCVKENISSEPKGSLKVVIKTSDNLPEPNAVVTTEPSTQRLISDSTGSVVFDNISAGVYKVIIELSPNSTSFADFDFILENIKVEESTTAEVFYTLIDGPSPITENPLNLDLLLSDSYRKLKDTYFIGNYDYIYWGDIGTNSVYVNPNESDRDILELDTYEVSVNNRIIYNVWTENYKGIRNTNIGLEAIQDSKYESPSNREEVELEAEFKFLRALFYFNMAKLYGNPVLVTSTDFNQEFLQSKEDLLLLIEEDLVFAEENLPSIQVSDIASKGAAQAMLGKFYLYLAGFPNNQTDKYTLAINQFEKVIGAYSLNENYEDTFNPQIKDSNKEIIFRIPFNSDENNGGNRGVFWGPKGYALRDFLLLDKSFVLDYFNISEGVGEIVTFPLDITDKRFFNNIASFTVVDNVANNAENIDDWRPLKFISDIIVEPQLNSSIEDFPLLRYADVLLMLAEAENAVNGPTQKAYDAINEVVMRSIGPVGILSNNLTQRELLLEIIKQRKLEFCFEGQYKDDLIRNELLESVILDFNERNPSFAKQFDTHEYIWPIPQEEIDLLPNLIQNPGY
ncbi:RagB/SusD family nutrient uptake outer membrane protein [Maribacter sp. 2210JD10-5]|uniref:RagB/SusD family nutrient uptake outer membrane protein n=1 Tax=Maribacter sp. 2210JD10-5 TaxID=3386272 RepID=UPI0039BD185C